MYKVRKPQTTQISRNDLTTGETIETKMERILNNQEPITDGAPVQYTDRKDGVRPEYDVRTDRFEIAVDAMNNDAKAKLAKRKEALEKRDKIENPEKTENSGDPKP